MQLKFSVVCLFLFAIPKQLTSCYGFLYINNGNSVVKELKKKLMSFVFTGKSKLDIFKILD